MAAETTQDVAIVGAGPVGGALACRLAAAGLRVLVADRAALPPMEHPDFDGRAYAIAAGSRPLLTAAGLWQALPLPVGPIHQIRVSDGRLGRPASRLHLHFGQEAAGDGPMGWMVEARNLRMALNARLHAEPGITLHAPAAVRVHRTPTHARLEFDGAPPCIVPLVIAAEGRDSALRQQAGITAVTWPYAQAAIVCAIAHERPHDGIALEHFLPAGPFAQLPLAATDAAPHASAIVWTDSRARVPALMALDEAGFAAELARRLGPHLGAIRTVGRRWSYPLSAMYVHRIVADRLALVGDAAHGIHPIAGQGLNLGLRDAIALADLLIAAHGARADLGDPAPLERYARARRVDVVSMLLATDGLDRLFSTNNPAVRLARDLGLAAVQRAPGLKAAFARQAMGRRRPGALPLDPAGA